jgi:BolA protein
MSRQQRIQNLLNSQLSPTALIIEDESHKHQRPGVETHFKIIAVSPQFKELTRIARHRFVNELLQEEFNLGLHALSLHLYTTEEWDKKTSLPTTPNCNSKGNA